MIIKFSNCGQLCHALKKLIVHESIFDEVVTKLKNIAESQIIYSLSKTNYRIFELNIRLNKMEEI